MLQIPSGDNDCLQRDERETLPPEQAISSGGGVLRLTLNEPLSKGLPVATNTSIKN